jgi:hypothetical protein
MDQKKSRNNIQNVGLLEKCGCTIYTIIIYRETTDILVCPVCQKFEKCA